MDESTKVKDLFDWLMSLDDGAGELMMYFVNLASALDCDLANVEKFKIDGGESYGILGVVDPSFWETVGVIRVGHKMLFARGIARLDLLANM